ncbi:MAG: hypothetical protein AAF492_26350, partial [Verrucomicrobiota bacterium]
MQPRSASAKSFAAPIVASLVFLTLLCTPSIQFGRLVTRVAFPSDAQSTVGSFRLVMVEPKSDTRAEKDRITFVVQCTDPDIEDIELCMEDDRISRFQMDYDEAEKQFSFVLEEADDSFRFWARSGRVLSRKYAMEVMQRPRIAEFSIGYTFPDYTGIETDSEVTASGSLKGFPGTEAAVTMTFNKPLEKATMDWLGQKQDLELTADGLHAKLDLTIRKSGTWSFSLLDREELKNLDQIEFPVVAMEDKAPTVRLTLPTGDVHLGLEDELPLTWDAADDFGVARQELIYLARGQKPQTIILDPSATNYDWDLSEHTLQTGDEASYRIRVYDARGAVAESQSRYVSLVKGAALSDAAVYREITDALIKEFAGIEKRLETVDTLAVKIKAGDKGAGV